MTTHNRSSEELQMRELVETWGRKRWPGARVMHEINVSQCRLDLAFVTETNLIGVEIKSSKDNLDRLEKQMRVFGAHIPLLYLALAPKWENVSHSHRLNVVVEETNGVKPGVYERGWGRHTEMNWRCYTKMLDILWAGELREIGHRHRFDFGSRARMSDMLPVIAAKLTGEQIVAEVCRELRSRPTNHKADPQVIVAAAVPLIEKAGALL